MQNHHPNIADEKGSQSHQQVKLSYSQSPSKYLNTSIGSAYEIKLPSSNERLAQRQQEVRSALKEIYSDMHSESKDEHKDNLEQITHHANHNVPDTPLLNFYNANTYTVNENSGESIEGESLSFDPVVLQDSDDLINQEGKEDDSDLISSDVGSASSLSSFSLPEIQEGASANASTSHQHIQAKSQTKSINNVNTSHLQANFATPQIRNHSIHASKDQMQSQDYVMYLQATIEKLKDENHHLQEELDIQKAEKVLLSPTKFQVELDSMRLAAEQVQLEAEEKVSTMERENKEIKDELENMKKLMTMNGVEQQYSTNELNDSVWEQAFNAILEQVCLLEESGLRKDPSLRMDHVVRDALIGMEESACGNDKFSKLESSLELYDYLERLAKGCGSCNTIDSIVSDGIESDKNAISEIGKRSHASGSESHTTGKYVSVGVDTDDLKCMGTLFTSALSSNNVSIIDAPLPHLQQKLSELQLENASLKGSNIHMKEQIVKYKKQVEMSSLDLEQKSSRLQQSFQLSEEQILHYNNLKKVNPQLQKEIGILKQNKCIIEEENRTVVERCVELESVAEDATQECETLQKKVFTLEQKVASLENSPQNLKQMQDIDDLNADLAMLQEQCDSLIATNAELELQLESACEKEVHLTKELEETKRELQLRREQIADLTRNLNKAKSTTTSDCNEKIKDLSVKLEKSKTQLRDLQEQFENVCSEKDSIDKKLRDQTEQSCKEISLLEEKIASMEQVHRDALVNIKKENEELLKVNTEKVEAFDKERQKMKQKLKDAYEELDTLKRRSQLGTDLEDECSRLRNLNGMIKAKIELVEDELCSMKEKNGSMRKQIATLETDCDNLRIENVSLADMKTDLEMEVKELEKSLSIEKQRCSDMEKELQIILSSINDDKTQPSSGREQNPEVKSILRLPSSIPENSRVGVQTPHTLSFGVATPAASHVNTFESPIPSTNAGSDPIEERIDRVNSAREKASQALRLISERKQKQEKMQKLNSLNETEKFVNNILNSCGKKWARS
ncbi:predicted protein [Chaetoceros tenuissimus]|uniref:Uncharacterized protein n=1 Tax=Chaetoceros tenuissimus TaxID=426638 RepID=A0AAD3H2R1_9STRA|nr:predicted protein [Chaetoceros tenuissimus]